MEIKAQQQQDEQDFELLIQGLVNDRYGCCDDFMEAQTVSGLRENLRVLNASGKMQPAGLGNQSGYHQDKQYRGDQIKWMDAQSLDVHEVRFRDKIENFILYLNKTCYTSIKGFESHYANYSRNNLYKRHVDQFKNDNRRRFSIILYLNLDWKDEDGGMLSLYPIDQAEKQISPLGGRMVFFRSDEMEHEVHPSIERDRQSIAGWLKR